MTSTVGSDYGNGANDIAGTSYDWGVHLLRLSGGLGGRLWRTLTKEEWLHILNIRTTTSGIRYVKAKVGNVNGLILLPDDWSTSYYSLNNPNDCSVSFDNNTIADWDALEQHGAVFLPAAGFRSGTTVYNVNSNLYYWSSSCDNSDRAYGVTIDISNPNNMSIGCFSSERSNG